MSADQSIKSGLDTAHLPHPADARAATLLRERVAALGPTEARFARSRQGTAVLDAIGGNSPYLADLAVRENATLRAVLATGPDAALARIMARLQPAQGSTPDSALGTALRQAKRQIALTVALADIAGAWPLDRVVAALSDFATRALTLAVDALLAHAAARHELVLPDPQHQAGSGFVVLGMGKLGAGELNYSSDIDLVLLYDPAPQQRLLGEAADGLTATFSRLARGLVALMQQRTADGYVFRTDLRLRPDPAATPPAVSLPAALTYYESLGQNWERAAMTKARPVAGDLAVGHAFLDAIKPFVWRRGLDFAAVADIEAMKHRIDAHRGIDRVTQPDPIAAIAGFDLKLGPGGIREIEFLTQTLELVWGGRDPTLRDPTTLGGLAALAKAGHLQRAAARELAEAYRLLRRLEHRLQMVDDRQTHTLPQSPEELARFAVFLGLPDAAALAALLSTQLDRVRARWRTMFETVPQAGAPSTQALDFSGPDPGPATVAQLAALGFADTTAIVAAVHAWQAGRVRALRSARARELIAEMLPQLLAAFARQPQPDATFARFASFVDLLPAGVQPLSLMQRNPALLDRIAAVLGAAPLLSEHLARVPQALEGLASPGPFPSPARLLRERLAEATSLEDAIFVLRRTRLELDFALSVATLEARLDVDTAGEARSDVADAILSALLPLVARDIARRFGVVPGGTVALVALGKAGSREMMAGSDLDLMLIYDHPPTIEESRPGPAGGRAVPVALYYARLAQSFIAALTAPGAEGPIYAVDMRLRPSGNAGPVAVSLASFRRYHREHAWTWERMAITRARVVAGPPLLCGRLTDAIATVIDYAAILPDAATTIRRDAATMRARLARDLPPKGSWDVKHRTGGLMEVEFIAQTLQLLHAGKHPGIAHPTTRLAFARLAASGLLAAADATLLSEADRLWRGVQGMLRLTLGRAAEAQLPQASAHALLRALARPEATDQPSLHTVLDATAAAVRDAFERLIGRPDPALLEKKP